MGVHMPYVFSADTSSLLLLYQYISYENCSIICLIKFIHWLVLNIFVFDGVFLALPIINSVVSSYYLCIYEISIH